MKVRQMLVPFAITKTRTYKDVVNKKKYICIHETANTSVGANADAHARLQYNGNSRDASWHWSVDDKECVQSFLHEAGCWGAGYEARDAIHIELCVNSDGDYEKAFNNLILLVDTIMKDEKIDIINVKQHNHFTGKNCPKIMREQKRWDSFISLLSKVTDKYDVIVGAFGKEKAIEFSNGMKSKGYSNYIKRR